MSDALRIDLITAVPDWERLEPCWDALLAATPGATVFQSYDYLRAWWNHLCKTDELRIVVARRGPIPVAIVPLERSAVKMYGMTMRRLGYFGTAPESDRPRMLAAPADAAECAETIADYLVGDAGEWDRISFAEQSAADPLATALIHKLRARGYLIRQPEGPACPIAALEGSWNTFLGTKSKNVRKSLKRKLAALDAAGDCQFESIAPDADHQAAALKRYLAVERASWKAGTAIAISRAPPDLAFYRELVARFAARGAVDFRFLSLNGSGIAATFGLIWNRRYYSLHIAHDAKFDDFSPGVVLTAREIEDAFAHRRYDTFDFLSGVLPNKGSWATATLPSLDLHIVRPDVRGRLFCWISFSLKPWAKRVARRARLMPLILRVKALLKRSEFDPE